MGHPSGEFVPTSFEQKRRNRHRRFFCGDGTVVKGLAVGYKYEVKHSLSILIPFINIFIIFIIHSVEPLTFFNPLHQYHPIYSTNLPTFSTTHKTIKMQYSNVLLLALAAGALAQNSTTKAGKSSATDASATGASTKAGKSTDAAASATATGKTSGNSTASGKASSTGAAKASSTAKTNSSSTTSGGTVKATTNGAPSLLAQSGGFVTVAGLGVAFAVFM
ncbi:uncharacterized protein PAC_11050 [Phialocephala subalpina]|uniref:Uncharacterized protein n=1 Tax=Phialocephala subalpina TaxID=576137 RepID=A0A1L7X810_9HELO|nr:uncharacterized protein PAC_11050 [Phialocephala subalpina]